MARKVGGADQLASARELLRTAMLVNSGGISVVFIGHSADKRRSGETRILRQTTIRATTPRCSLLPFIQVCNFEPCLGAITAGVYAV